MATARPVGRSARPRPAESVTSSRACRSYPASCSCCWAGSTASGSRRVTGMRTPDDGGAGRALGVSGGEVANKLFALRVGERDVGLVLGVLDDDAHRRPTVAERSLLGVG